MPTTTVIERLLTTLSLSAAPLPAPPAVATMDESTRAPHRASLLGIPPELRLHIYDYMSLWPGTEAGTQWTGAYYACRTLYSEMKAHLPFEREIASNLDRMRGQQAMGDAITFTPIFSLWSSCLLRGVTLTIPIRYYDMYPASILQSVYELYLDHVMVILQGTMGVGVLPPYGDLKSLDRQAFMDYVASGRVNCKRVTISIEHLANADGGRDKSTDLENFEGNIPYTLTIVQNSRGKQTERSFFSSSRFRP